MGRKSIFWTQIAPHMDNIAEWANAGATKAEIAKRLGVAPSSVRKFCALGEKGDERYKAFAAAFAQACAVADDAVENALYKTATGYKEQVLKHYKVKVVEYDDAGRRVAEREELREAYDEVAFPANVSAQQFWLTNRQPERWKRQPEAAQTEDGDASGVVLMPDVSGDAGNG